MVRSSPPSRSFFLQCYENLLYVPPYFCFMRPLFTTLKGCGTSKCALQRADCNCLPPAMKSSFALVVLIALSVFLGISVGDRASCMGGNCSCKKWALPVVKDLEHLRGGNVGLRGGQPDFDLAQELAELGAVDISDVVRNGAQEKATKPPHSSSNVPKW